MSSISSNEARPGQLLPYAMLFLTWGLVHLGLILFRDVSIFNGNLVGPDSYMRMLRVDELYHGHGWFNGTIARANAPYGDTLHWTRPFDLLIMLVALPVSLFTGFEQALFVAGKLVSPLLQLATALALVWTLRPLIRPMVWFLPAVALFLQPGALTYSILGRADHHALLLLAFVITSGFMLRALRNPLDSRPALLAGIAAGFGVWLSVEFLLVLGLCLVALGLPWLCGERERAAQNKWFALGTSIAILIALLAERPFPVFFEPTYDRISCVHFVIAVCCLLFWRTVETYEGRSGQASRLLGRTILLAAGGSAAILLLAATFPEFFGGPMVKVDPRIQALWLDRVVEMRPIMPRDRDSLGRFIFFLGGGLIAVPLFLKGLFDERSSRRFWPLCYIALASLALWIVGVSHIRFSGYAETAFIMAFAIVLDQFLLWTGRMTNDLVRGLLHGSFLALALLGPVVIGGALMDEVEAKDSAGQPIDGCDVHQVADYLNSDPRWAQDPQNILAFLDIGPELLYRTNDAVVATPYHRNADGIYDSHRILTSREDEPARELVTARKVDLVLLCHSPAERAFFADPDGADNLYSRLDQGHPPAWLEAVELPANLRRSVQLYHVVR